MREYILEHGGLSDIQKAFLTKALDQGKKVEIIESNSELMASKDMIWARQCENQGYYDGLLESGCGVALVMSKLIVDVPIWTHEGITEDDKYQVREIKGLLDDEEEN